MSNHRRVYGRVLIRTDILVLFEKDIVALAIKQLPKEKVILTKFPSYNKICDFLQILITNVMYMKRNKTSYHVFIIITIIEMPEFIQQATSIQIFDSIRKN